MTLFEFIFGLSTVILGLALAQIATSLQRLAMAGRRVRWAPEPLLLAVLLILVIVLLWALGWRSRDVPEVTVADLLSQLLQLLLPFMAAGAVLPEQVPPEGRIDLLEHYNRTRRFTFGAMAVGLTLATAVSLSDQAFGAYAAPPSTPPQLLSNAAFVALYVALMWVRARWINIAGLLVAVAVTALATVSIRLTG